MTILILPDTKPIRISAPASCVFWRGEGKIPRGYATERSRSWRATCPAHLRHACVAEVRQAEDGGDLDEAGDDRPHAHDQHRDQRGGPGQANAIAPAARSTSPSSRCPIDRSGLGTAERPQGLQAGGDEVVHGEQDDKRQHRDPGQASAMASTARARMPRTIRDVLGDFSMTVPFAPPPAQSADLCQASA